MQSHQHAPQIWTIEHFISPAECADLIARSEALGYVEAEVGFSSGAAMMKGLRNNYRAIFTDPALAARLWERLRAFCPAELDGSQASGLNEQFRFYKYESTQRFKRHIDGRFQKSPTEESRITFMIYLNEEFEGGETTFDALTIMPKTGQALCFIHELKHEGRPVSSGVKYALRSDVMYRQK